MDQRGVDEVLFDGDLAQRGRRVCRAADDGKLSDGHGGWYSFDGGRQYWAGRGLTSLLTPVASGEREACPRPIG